MFATLSYAEDDNTRSAREEVEDELHHLVGSQPTKVRIDFSALDEPNYKLEEVSFDLDGRSLATPATSELAREGTHLVWNGDVKPGKHSVHAHVVYANPASIVMSDEGDHKWKVTGDVSFEVNAGIEVQVRVVPSRDPSQRDIAKRFRLSLPAKPVMLARLDDGKMPDRLEAPVIASPAVEEAQETVAKVGPGTSRRKVRTAAAPVELAQAETTPRKGHATEPAADPVEPPPEPAEARADPVAIVDPPPDVSPPDAGVVGLPVQRPGTPVEEGEGMPWVIIAAVGVLAVVLLLVVLIRRRGSKA